MTQSIHVPETKDVGIEARFLEALFRRVTKGQTY